jgi:uncharacterized membrane protein YoaK (UPF0700 family)
METRLPARPLIVLTFSTGIVDAASFLALGGVFAAMQTGNVVFLGIGTAGAGDAPFLAPLIGLGAFLGGGLLAARVVDSAGGAVFLPRWLVREAGLLALAALLAALLDVDPGHASAYLLIVLLSLTMGLRNTFVRGTAGPNLATTVLTLTLTAATPGTALTTAGPADLSQRAAGLLAILGGAVAGALLFKSSLALALLLAAAATLTAALSTASDPGEELAQP